MKRLMEWCGVMGAACLLFPASPALAQRQPPMAAPMEMRPLIFTQAVQLPSPVPGKIRMDVQYRVDVQFFVSVRNTQPQATAPYRRRGEVFVEVLDSTGISAARKIVYVDLAEQTAESRPRVFQWHQGVLAFDLPPGPYRVRVEVSDLESRRRHTSEEIYVRTSSGDPSRISPASAFFVAAPSSADIPDSLVLDNYGLDYQFSAPRSLCIVLPADSISTEAARVEYTLQALASSRVDSSVHLRRTEENLPILRGVQLTPGTTRDTARYRIERGARGTASLVLLPLPTLTMPLRGYVLNAEITVGGRSWMLRRPFRALWPDMPFSLREVDRALDVLRYVANESTLDSLRDGDFEQRRDNLENFWKPRDQTPETAMNEVMAEYYRRADHAMMAFSTLAQPDGVRTDRGRIYILHGPPARTDRTLHPREGYVEIWEYDHLRKRFTFVDPLKKGEYVLSSTSSL